MSKTTDGQRVRGVFVGFNTCRFTRPTILKIFQQIIQDCQGGENTKIQNRLFFKRRSSTIRRRKQVFRRYCLIISLQIMGRKPADRRIVLYAPININASNVGRGVITLYYNSSVQMDPHG